MNTVPASTWSEARRLLCVRLDNAGDVLMTTPAIRGCRETFGCRVTLRREKRLAREIEKRVCPTR